MEPREYQVDAGALRLSVRDLDGASEGTPVVCLHGLASNARWWDLVAPRLAPRRVVALDQRGHGHSDKPDDGYDFDTVVSDARGAARALELGPLVVAGHSWGASVALAWAAADPDAVRAVVCVDGGVGDLRGYFGGSWQVAERAMRPPDFGAGIEPAQLHGWVQRSGLAGDGDASVAESILRGNFDVGEDGRLRPHLSVDRHMKIAYALYHLDSAELMSRVRVPVLLLLALREGLDESRRASAALSSLPPGSSLQWIEGIHDLPVQRPAEVGSAMATFLGGLGL